MNKRPPHGQAILAELRKKKYRQVALVNHLGATKSMMSQILTGKRKLTPQMAIDIADSLPPLTARGLLQMQFDWELKDYDL